MKTKIDSEYTSRLFQALDELQSVIGGIPEAFMASEGNNKFPRPEGVGFDVNLFLEVFDKIQLKAGMVLDYAFLHGGIGGEPLIYTRQENAPKLSADQYKKRFDDIDAKPYLTDLQIDKNPEAFFQIIVFSQVVHQFYQHWHALYNDHRFVLSLTSAKKILKSIPEKEDFGISKEQRKFLEELSFDPEVCTDDSGAGVRCVMFSDWIGFYYADFRISWPEISLDKDIETIIQYTCGICF